MAYSLKKSSSHGVSADDLRTAAGRGTPGTLKYAQVPDELREWNQWMLWMYKEIDGRWVKVPISPWTGRAADYREPSSWASFDEAVEALAKYPDCEGIGFVFTDEDPFVGIDMDGCIDANGLLSPAAEKLVKQFSSYTDLSRSKRGVKIIIKGRKPPGSKCISTAIPGIKQLEIYQTKRFFALTGQCLEGTPRAVNRRPVRLYVLCRRLWPRKISVGAPLPLAPRFTGDEETLLQMMMRSTKFRKLWEGDISAYDNDDSRADLALCSRIAYWTGDNPTLIDRLFHRSKLYRDKWEREDYRTSTIARACRRAARRVGAIAAEFGHIDADGRRTIVLGTDLHRVVDNAIEALAADPGLYQRGGKLVHVVREKSVEDSAPQISEAPCIRDVTQSNLLERLSRCATFVDTDGDPQSPRGTIASMIRDRAQWHNLRVLKGISDTPVLRPDGSLHQSPGYDAKTGVLYNPDGPFPEIPEHPTKSDVEEAVRTLREVVCNFPFEGEAHFSAWLAALLTPLARYTFRGPTPLFLVDANVRAAGKGKLVDVISQIVFGREMAVSPYSADDDEMRKRITSIARAGTPAMLLDNIAGELGNPSLDAALTTTRWEDRCLGTNDMIRVPLHAVWFATGNNVQLAADTTRRVVPIRLDVLLENPEQRTDFKHPDLIEYVQSDRPRLLAAALTIIAGFLRSGERISPSPAFGSYEGWSRVVRAAVIWAGLPDPCLTRTGLEDRADTGKEVLVSLIQAFRAYDPDNGGVIVRDMVEHLYPAAGDYPADRASKLMRSALDVLCGTSRGKPTAQRVGNKLKGYRRRVCGGYMLDLDPVKERSGALWRLYDCRDGTNTPASAVVDDAGSSPLPIPESQEGRPSERPARRDAAETREARRSRRHRAV